MPAAYDFGQGFDHKKGKQETPAAFQALTCYLQLGRERSQKKVAEVLGESLSIVHQYAKRYAWRERAAAYDADQMQARFSEVRQQRESEHRAAILRFRDDQARRARAMGKLAELMLELTEDKLMAMRDAGELPSEQQLSNLAKTVATLSDTSMQLEATALGVDELLENALEP